MKTRTIIEEINHDDLVDLLSTALYGSSMFACDYSKDEYREFCQVDENDCIEDKMAKLLLAGKSIRIGDMYAEDEDDHYKGLNSYHWDDEREIMWYDVTLDDIRIGVQRCLDCKDDDGYIRRCAVDFINGVGDMDMPEAESIMQVILWEGLIYG